MMRFLEVLTGISFLVAIVQVCAFEFCRKRALGPHRNWGHQALPTGATMDQACDPGEDIKMKRGKRCEKPMVSHSEKVIYNWWVVLYVGLQELKP